MSIEGNYMFDLDKVIEFIFESNNPKPNDSEITEIYGRNEVTNIMELQQKQLREMKGETDATKYGVKYDLFKSFLEVILSIEPSEVTFGEAMVMNALANKGLIKKVE